MNKLVVTSLVAALSGVFGAPATVRAGDGEVIAAIGGFIGGVIVGATVGDDHRHGPVVVSHPPRVIVTTPHRYHGYWDWVTVKTWVPGRWIVRYDDCGQRIRYFERGHYAYRKERVWVDGHRGRDYRDGYHRR